MKMRMFGIWNAYFMRSLRKILAYRINILNHAGSIMLPISINYFVWDSIIQNNDTSYDLPQMMVYIVFANLIYVFTSIRADSELEQAISSSRFGQLLLRPVNFVTDTLLGHLMDGICKLLLVYLPIMLIVGVCFQVHVSLVRLPVFLLVLIAAVALNAALAFIIGFLSFWLTEIWGIAAIRNILVGLLSGTMFPFDMFSREVQRLFMLSPFPYMAYVPAKVITDLHFDLQVAYQGLAVSCVWLCAFISTAYVMYRKGVRRYTVKGV